MEPILPTTYIWLECYISIYSIVHTDYPMNDDYVTLDEDDVKEYNERFNWLM